MKINRREFLLLSAGLMAAAGCQSASVTGGSLSNPEQTVNAGPVGQYAADGVYNDFRDRGFFLIRKDGKLLAISAICTHKKCKLTAESDRSFYCKCHGSTFDPAGHVTAGPAKRDLPVLALATDANGQVLVQVPAF